MAHLCPLQCYRHQQLRAQFRANQVWLRTWIWDRLGTRPRQLQNPLEITVVRGQVTRVTLRPTYDGAPRPPRTHPEV